MIKSAVFLLVLLSTPVFSWDDDYRPNYSNPPSRITKPTYLDYKPLPSVVSPIEFEPPENISFSFFGEFFEGAIKGDYIQEQSLFNVIGNIVASNSPVAIVTDGRDFVANFQKSLKNNFKENKVNTAVSAVAFVPVVGDIGKFKKMIEVGEFSKYTVKAVKGEVKFARAMESGLTIRLQTAITQSVKEGEFIAVRKRVYAASRNDGIIPAKGPYIIEDKKFKSGTRLLADGQRVNADLDLAFVAKQGRALSENVAMKRGAMINRNYDYDVVTHGDNFNGARRGIEKAIEIENKSDEVVYIFNKKGFVESGTYQDMVSRYIRR